jgi:5'-nucleotidase
MQRFREDDPGIDGAALHGRYVSVTPIRCDMTDYDGLDRLHGWGLELNGHEGEA